jgi:hypothetical protein
MALSGSGTANLGAGRNEVHTCNSTPSSVRETLSHPGRAQPPIAAVSAAEGTGEMAPENDAAESITSTASSRRNLVIDDLRQQVAVVWCVA